MTKNVFFDCTIQKDCGSVEGYVCGRDDENWGNYLADVHVGNDLIEVIEAAPIERVAILKDLYVEGTARGFGLGTGLVTQILQEFEGHGAELTLLVADMYEANEFSLVEWYQDWGFERVDCSDSGPLMVIASDELVARLRESSGYEPPAETPAP
ncbi:GNAT family N-acetyltransferase [Salipiger sp. PrR003]|uniref:GNAT family N-acetyltransferase n=1 Tax=Salipiger sp. PrR003 TaxID=2706776 RepID=UPI0013DA6B9A|nr:GNAT family N-acetyltransferase [Salipiger sp. PrR003]NDV50385.1 GNAT family N-acetyltransferase [Salipiger sp. PrR003]